MFIRKKKGVYKDKIYINYQLVESVRTPNGPRQKVICSLGNLKGRTQKEWLELARKVESRIKRPSVKEKTPPLQRKSFPLLRCRRVPFTARKCLLLTFAESLSHGVDDSSPHRSPIRIWA